MLKREQIQLKITHEEVRTIVTSCKNWMLSPSFSMLLHEALRCEFMAIAIPNLFDYWSHYSPLPLLPLWTQCKEVWWFLNILCDILCGLVTS